MIDNWLTGEAHLGLSSFDERLVPIQRGLQRGRGLRPNMGAWREVGTDMIYEAADLETSE